MNEPRLGRAAPIVPTRDVERAITFYRAAFGLEVTFTNGAPTSYAVLKKDDAEVHLARCDEPSPRSANVMHLMVSDAEHVLASAITAGATIVEPLRDAPWGMRTFVVADLEGHRVDVGQPLRDR